MLTIENFFTNQEKQILFLWLIIISSHGERFPERTGTKQLFLESGDHEVKDFLHSIRGKRLFVST